MEVMQGGEVAQLGAVRAGSGDARTALVPVTVLVHTRNEERNLPHTLGNVTGWADQVCVIDSDSTDRTAEIAREFGAELFSRACDRRGLVEQRNWALDTLPIRNAWVFVLDADELMDDELKAEVAAITRANPQDKDGFWLRFKVIFLGKWIRGASMYPSWSLRLFRRAVVRYERREVNAHPQLAPGREGFLQGHLLHEDRRGFKYFLERLNEFSSLESAAYLRTLRGGAAAPVPTGRFFGTRAERRRYLKNIFIRLPFRPLVIFTYLYVVRRGFLDGRAGFDYCVLKAVTEWAVTVKMREASS